MPRMKILKVYLTDNYYIKKLLIGRLGLEPKNGIYGGIDESGITRLLYFPENTILSGKKGSSAAYECLEKCDKSTVCVYYNAFEPGRGGALRWHALSQRTGLGNKDVRRCDLLTADFADRDALPMTTDDSVTDADAAEAELLIWTWQLMAAAYSGAAKEKGVELAYDPLIFPLLSEIAAGDAVAEEDAAVGKGKGRPALPYSYLDLFCELDGQVSMTDLTEILFDFYGGGLLSWPMATGRCAALELEEYLLTPASLFDTPYGQAAMPYRYRSLPGRLYQGERGTCGLWLLDDGDFAETYGSLGEKQRLVIDALIKRQLALFAPETAGDSPDTAGIAAGGKGGNLHTASSLVRLLQIHAAGSQEDIMEVMTRLSSCRYVCRRGGGYLIRKDDQRLLQYLPEDLHSMDLYSRMRNASRKAVKIGKKAGAYKEAAEKAVMKNAVKIQERIDAAMQAEESEARHEI